MNPRDRLQVVINHKLCHNCLLPFHNTDNCGARSVCGVSGCGQKHTMYIQYGYDMPSSNVKVSNAGVFLLIRQLTCP